MEEHFGEKVKKIMKHSTPSSTGYMVQKIKDE